VLDAGGHPVRVSRMDGCNFLSSRYRPRQGLRRGGLEAAVRRAQQAVRDTGAGSGMVGISGQRMVPVQGALPIWSDGRCVGSIGVSGARWTKNEEAARPAIHVVGFADSRE